eukprot:TRINITY_DN1747_c0_g1_i1.p1 TRINITY_DN1747_c0_g1~~TRINITY_DN1747_c0_g1_i1.p1  ORF type:complete len:139 (+),score=20.14 TRINITY_DN1747_c0_g1_i1:46-462(+)
MGDALRRENASLAHRLNENVLHDVFTIRNEMEHAVDNEVNSRWNNYYKVMEKLNRDKVHPDYSLSESIKYSAINKRRQSRVNSVELKTEEFFDHLYHMDSNASQTEAKTRELLSVRGILRLSVRGDGRSSETAKAHRG